MQYPGNDSLNRYNYKFLLKICFFLDNINNPTKIVLISQVYLLLWQLLENLDKITGQNHQEPV